MDKKQFEREIKYEYLFEFYKKLYEEGVIPLSVFYKAERIIRERYRPIVSQINLYNA